MGGIWGLASASALENLPVEARGLGSGILQQGYAGGYLIAAIVNLYLVSHVGWRWQFRTSACVSASAALLRIFLPESEVFLRARQERKPESSELGKSKTRIFFHEVGHMLKKHWLLCIYAVLLMSGFNFLSHGSQDLYPTYLQENKNIAPRKATVATIIGNCGAITYAFLPNFYLDVRAISQPPNSIQGRRYCRFAKSTHRSPSYDHVRVLTSEPASDQPNLILFSIFVLLVGAFIPLWILPDTFSKLAAGAFCLQFGVQG